uniref:Uncharacterized protein n=1 Tax=uncultured marine thaumarchaeote AD1000_20_B03 TaxID=1455899 RepID=A0A075FRV4_9ARCH|nr:hypothetical protein [uncultured marine thaumarchaeote AD1000_20_B03]
MFHNFTSNTLLKKSDQIKSKYMRSAGFEPASQGWKPRILTRLYYDRICANFFAYIKMVFYIYPDVQPLYPQSIQMLHPSTKISLFLHVGHKVSSFSSSTIVCVILCVSSSLIAVNALLI